MGAGERCEWGSRLLEAETLRAGGVGQKPDERSGGCGGNAFLRGRDGTVWFGGTTRTDLVPGVSFVFL